MNHYDDLQRFKDKTRTQQHDFKDLSSQNLANEHGNWAILNQLSPVTEESALAMGGHVSIAVPQSVNPETFAVKESAPAAAPQSLEMPSSSAPSIFQGVASQLSAAPAALSVAPAAKSSVSSLAEQLDNAMEQLAAPAIKPAAAPQTYAPAPEAPTAPVNFAQLFAPKPAESKKKVEKNQPLKSLLERIASCR